MRKGNRLYLLTHFYEANQLKIIYRDSHGTRYEEKVLAINRKKDFISQFSSYDAYIIGYLLGSEESLHSV